MEPSGNREIASVEMSWKDGRALSKLLRERTHLVLQKLTASERVESSVARGIYPHLEDDERQEIWRIYHVIWHRLLAEEGKGATSALGKQAFDDALSSVLIARSLGDDLPF